MDTKNIDLFRTVCFIALMQRGKGLVSKSPSYIKQKLKISEDPLSAWQMLDFEGQILVKSWADDWGFNIQEILDAFSKETSS